MFTYELAGPLLKGPLADQPAASAGRYWYFADDENGGTLYKSDGSAWTKITTGATNPITSGALPTVTLVSGAGQQIDITRDVDTYTAVTYNSLIATNATCKLELSPDGLTYSTLGTITKPIGVAFAGEIGIESVRVPKGWYLRATVVQAVLGATTYA